MNPEQIKKVHVVFKTHLDIGFTNYAETVIDQYMNHHIPHSINLAFEMNTKEKKEFIWTLGSYMIDYYLKNAQPEAVERLKLAIERGDICWHGLACTTHTELMDKDLLDYNLSISNRLDQQFHRETIAAKMTDVPGHTKAMIQSLSEHGIRYLHIGTNASSMVPEVPLSFVWRCGGHDLIVQYSFNYGAPCYVEGMDELLEFAHTGDNLGPQDAESVRAEMDRIRAKYPNAEVVASTLDDYARCILPYKDQLPVIEDEIGDTWIHGTGTDPLKVARYRALVQLKNEWQDAGKLTPSTPGYEDFKMNLIMIAEHTWGMDFKKYLADFTNWKKEDFEAARKADATTLDFLTNRNASMMEVIQYDLEHYRGGVFTGSYKAFERSHEEQREYLNKALCNLPEALQKEAKAAINKLEKEPLMEVQPQSRVAAPYETISVGDWQVAFGGNGEMVQLQKKEKDWIGEKGCFGRLVYSTYNAVDCVNNYYRYNRNFRSCQSWSEPDFSKPGVEFFEELEHRDYVFGAAEIRVQGEDVRILLRGQQKAAEEFGCPREAEILYHFGPTITCTLRWRKKDANKSPEGLWFDFNLNVGNPWRWQMQKMGQMISPMDVVRGGNRRHHCVEAMKYAGGDGRITVRNIHSPMISIGGHWLYGEYRDMPSMADGFSYCLFNNKWGTNFKMWCEDDCTFQYEIAIDEFPKGHR